MVGQVEVSWFAFIIYVVTNHETGVKKKSDSGLPPMPLAGRISLKINW